MMKTFTKLFVFFALNLFAIGAMAQTPYYVNAAKVTSGDGKSWGQAFKTLQEALDAATTSGDEIFVAKGTYKPSAMFATGVASPGTAGPDNRYNTFQLKSGVAIYGGYDDQGNGTRSIFANETILSGDLGTVNDNSDNAYNVVMLTTGTTGVLLDGFTITDGYANGNQGRAISGASHFSYYGGGIFLRNSNGTFKNLRIVKNGARTNSSTVYGGGFFISNNTSDLIELDNIEFIENNADSNTGLAHGGALYLAGANIKMNRLRFIKNTTKSSGGAIFASLAATNVKLSNSVFYDNSAGANGGAIYVTDNGAVAIVTDIVNNTFYKNKSTSGGAIHLVSTNRITATISNSILLDNEGSATDNDIFKGANANFTITYSLTQGAGTGETGVVTDASSDNVFINTTDVNHVDFLKLKYEEGNPAIDAGSNALYQTVLGVDPLLDKDLTGTADRVFNSGLKPTATIDMGAYENTVTPLPVVLSASLSAKANTNSAVLTWATASETNNSHFILERSTDGVNFVTIATPASKGNGAKYSHTDFSPTNGTNYYRLTQVDNDGIKVTYDPVSVNFSLKDKIEINVYPNPANGGSVTVTFGAETFNKLELYNVAGQVLRTQNVSMNMNSTVVDIANLNKGVYFIKLSGTGKTITQKVIKN